MNNSNLSQPFFTGKVFFALTLDLLKEICDVLALRPSDPDAAFWLGYYKIRVERDNPLPHPAGHTAFAVAQDMVGLLACKHTLPARIQARCIYRLPGVLFTTIPGTFFSGLLSIPSFLSMC